MKTLSFIFLFFLNTSLVFSQKISNIDFDKIKSKLEESGGFYKKLLERFIDADSTLTQEEYNIIYYGQCFQKNYNPYFRDTENFDKFRKHYQENDFAKALPIALKMIGKDPLDMKMTFYTLVCYHGLKDEDGKSKMATRYNGIIRSIFESGDGKSDATAFVVMNVSDEYELMANLEVQNTSQSLRGYCDVMTLKENDLGIKELYFNVSKPLESMMKKLKGKD
jgi:hypothetical protein